MVIVRIPSYNLPLRSMVWNHLNLLSYNLLRRSTSLLTTREQVHLDWLFSLSSELRYNLCPTAGSWLGCTHTAEAKAKMSGNTNRLGKTGHTHTAIEAKAAPPRR